jgi:hypothetical protein
MLPDVRKIDGSQEVKGLKCVPRNLTRLSWCLEKYFLEEEETTSDPPPPTQKILGNMKSWLITNGSYKRLFSRFIHCKHIET